MADLEEFYLNDLVHKGGTLLESSNGDLDTVSGLANLEQALFHRLITVPGSLVHRPNYGVGIKQYQNAIGSIDTFRKIAAAINDQFIQDFRILDVRNVDIQQDQTDPGLFKIVVTVQTAGYAELPLTFIPFGEG